MRAILMCGGDDEKWTRLGGEGRRHFCMVGRETVIGRIIRQLAERDVTDVWIVAPMIPEYRLPGTHLVEPEYREWGHEALNGRSAWSESGRTLQLYGDTVFTDAAMDTIVGFSERKWQAFGRYGPGGVSKWGELFGMSFWPGQGEAWHAAVAKSLDLAARGFIWRGGSWEGMRILGGAEGSAITLNVPYPRLFTEINDGTDDFDTPEEYAALLDALAVAA